MRFIPLASIAFVLAAVGCGAADTGDDAEEGSAASTEKGAPDFSRSFSGGGSLWRLTKTGNALKGQRYDIAPSGSYGSIQGKQHDLTGTFRDDLWRIDEAAPAGPSDCLLAHCDPDPAGTKPIVAAYTGAFDANGTFRGFADVPHGGGEQTPLELEVIAPGVAAKKDGALLATHLFGGNLQEPTTCLRGGSYPSIFGLADAKAEAAVNASLATTARDASRCQGKPKGSANHAIVPSSNIMGVLSLYSVDEGLDAADATIERRQKFINVSLETGKYLGLRDMLKSDSTSLALLTAKVDAALARSDSKDDAKVKNTFHQAIQSGKLAALLVEPNRNEMRLFGLVLAPDDQAAISAVRAERTATDLFNNIDRWGVFVSWADLYEIVDPAGEVAHLAACGAGRPAGCE